MANPYYIDPLGGFNAGQAAANIGSALMQRKERESQNALMSQAADVFRSGNAQAMADFMIQNPQMRDSLIQAQGFKDATTMKARMDGVKRILSGEDHVYVANQTADAIQAAGGNPSDTLSLIDRSPEEAKTIALQQLALMNPQAALAYGKATAKESGAEGYTLSEGQVRFDAQNRPVAGVPKQQKEDTQAVKDLRSRYDKFTGDLRKTDAAYRKIQTAPKTAAGDMSLIFGYMKLLDPGSTVREGEFATAESAAGVPTRILNAYNRALSGERLADDQRKEFLQSAKAAFSAQQESADISTAEILQQADQDGVPRERVIGAEALRAFEKRAADRLINKKQDVNVYSSVLGREITEQEIMETLSASPGMTREQLLIQLGVK